MKGHLKEIRPGTWRAWIDLPRGEDGKRRQKCLTIHAKGRREAESLRAKAVADADAGNVAAPSRATLEGYLLRWLEYREAQGLAPKTIETWRDFARAHIIPRLGGRTLGKIQPKDVREFHTHLLTSGRRDGNGGLSPQTVTHIHRLLSEVLKTAVREGLIPRNPCEQVPVPRTARKERSVGEPDLLPRLLAAAEGSWLRLPILLAVGAGLRRGEILALRWDAVDLKAGTLTIRQQAQSLRGQGLSFKTPKTPKARRTISLPEFVVDELRKHKGCQAESRLLAGPAWEDHGLVVTQEDGRPRTPDNLSHGFGKLLKRAGIPHLAFHDLRHVAATMQIAEGVPLKVVSERLGHSSIHITADLYGHVLPAMDRDAAEKTDAALRRVLAR